MRPAPHSSAKRTAGLWAIAVSAWLAVSLLATLARAGEAAPGGGAEPGFVARVGEIARVVYDKADSTLVGPARRAAAAALADPRPRMIYDSASATARELAAAADERIVQPIARETAAALARPEVVLSTEAAGVVARGLGEKMRRYVLAPLLSRSTPADDAAVAKAPAAPEDMRQLAAAVGTARQLVAMPDLPDIESLQGFGGKDPLEGFNRFVFGLNNGLRIGVFEPVADFYLRNTSRPVQNGVHNFFWNLREPLTLVSSLLEGEFRDAGNATVRFGINTTLGIAGLFDPATRLGFPVKPRNFEETLCVYGLPSGPYVVLPILGPATFRDAVGRLATVVAYYEVMGLTVYVPYRVSDIALQYADARDKVAFMNSISIDPYVVQKALYLTTRNLSCGRQTAIDREFFTK